MESENCSPTPGQSGQEDRDEDNLEDDLEVRIDQSHRPVDDSNSEAVSCSHDDYDDENLPGPSSRVHHPLGSEPETSRNGFHMSHHHHHPLPDAISDSDSEPDFDGYAGAAETVDSDSREAWAASSSDRHSNVEHFSPRPSNWKGPSPQSTSWSISSSSAARVPSSLFSVASSASSLLSSSSQQQSRSPVASTSAHGEISNPPSPMGEPEPMAGPSSRDMAEPSLASAHGEISNPPTPLGGQVVEDSDMRAADSPQAGPSGYFGAPFLPDPVSNPASPQAGPSTGTVKRRTIQPDSFASNKRGRFEPTPGPSGLFIPRHNLNVSSSEAVAMSIEPMSPYQPNSPALPHTPADNNQISSSTGFNYSVPPTPGELQVESNDLSVPSPMVPRRVNHDVDDGVDSTVDSSGYSLANHLQEEDEGEEMSSHVGQNEVEAGCVQSSQYEDSSGDEDEEATAAASLNVVHPCTSQSNSNDAISTSGQIDESNFGERKDLFAASEEPVAGPSTSNRDLYNNGTDSRHFVDVNLDMLPLEGSVDDIQYVDDDQHHHQHQQQQQFQQQDFANRMHEPSYFEASSSFNNRHGPYKSQNENESPRLFGLMSERPSTSKGFSQSNNQQFNPQVINNFPERNPCDSKSGDQPSVRDFGASNHVMAFSNQHFQNVLGAAAEPSNIHDQDPDRYLVEAEPSKLKNYRGNAAENEVDKSGDNFDPFLPDFDSAEGNLPTASFGQPVDLEDIQVQNLGADSFCSSVQGRSPIGPGVDSSSPNQARSFSSNVSSSGEQPPSFSISLAFEGLTGSLAESAPSTSGMTGPLSKRLRTLHSLQQQKKEHVSTTPKDETEEKSSAENFPFPSTSQRPNNNNGNNNHDDDSDGGSSPFLGGTQQTFSVTIETIGTGNAIKPKKFFQQKSAVDTSLLEHIEDKSLNGQSFNSFSAFVDPTCPLITDKKIQGIALSKGKRQRKSRIVWCPDCQVHYNQDCLVHKKAAFQISDHPVMSRARASLPSSYLVIKKVDKSSYGVFTKKLIPKSCRFGPIEGRILTSQMLANKKCENDSLRLLIRVDDGSVNRLDVSDEDNSNWMRYVRQAETYSDQNTLLNQENGQLYFTTTRNVSPKQELRVWYSKEYAELFDASEQITPLESDGKEDDLESDPDFLPWQCFCCNKRFVSSNLLQQHLMEHEDQDTTPKVKKVTRGKMVYQPRHLKSYDKKSAKKLRCPICPRVFDRQFSLQRHLALHMGDKSLKCDECQARFSLPFNLSRHRKKVHFVDPTGTHTRCTTCGLWFKTGPVFKIHVLSHQPKWKVHHNETLEEVLAQAGRRSESDDSVTQYNCPQCDHEFETWFDLVNHSNQHGSPRLPHSSIDGIRTHRTDKKGKLLHKCELCYKAFASEDRLSRHMAVHGSDEAKPLACIHCGKRFLSNSALACHLKVHSGDSNFYDCPICSATFDQIHALKEHVHVHRQNDSYACPHCTKTFGIYAQIRKHIRAFHAEKKFPCSQCDKSFTGADKLKAHMVKHSDRREFMCLDCGKQFKRKDKLKDHVKRMHSSDKRLKVAAVKKEKSTKSTPKVIPKVIPTDYHRFIYKCHDCMLGFKRRGMLVNHMAKRHPNVPPENVPELNLPILKTTKDYFCQYCSKVYKSSSKRKVHILKNHPGAKLPPSVRDKVALAEEREPNPTYSATVGSVTSQPYSCPNCHKQYASNAKLLQHLRKKHQSDDVMRMVSRQNGESSKPDNRFKFDLEPMLDENPGVAYVTVDASSLEGGSEHAAPLIHLQNVYPSTSNLHLRGSRNLVFHTEGGANFGSGLDLTEIRLGEATLVPVQSERGELSPGLECRTVDGEILQLQLTRVHQSDALRLASSGATVIHVPADQQSQQGTSSMDHQGYRNGLSHRSNSGLVVFNAVMPSDHHHHPGGGYLPQGHEGFMENFDDGSIQNGNNQHHHHHEESDDMNSIVNQIDERR